ncbi:MAG: ISKra4 family transposase, partial [Nitrospiria bacterium]
MMKIHIQVVIDHEDGQATPLVEEVACLHRGDLLPETLGLTLAEGKQLLAKVQQGVVQQQVETSMAQQQHCPHCRKKHTLKDYKPLTIRTVFGKFQLKSPRFYTCPCQAQKKHSFSPLASQLPERTTPELKYLQTKWASLVSYGLTVDLLEEVLPLQVNTRTIRRQVQQVAEKMEAELEDEQASFSEGMFLIWDQLPEPDPPLTVGIDGGYVHARENDNRKAGWFEVIVGKSVPEVGDPKRFAFVHQYDEKPKRRLYETLKSQGLQMHQAITFWSDGADTVRSLQ